MMACNALSRRQLLQQVGAGFGSLALSAMLAEESLGEQPDASWQTNPLAVRPGHFAPRAARVIFLFMHGGPSHVDLFDPKPELTARDGQPLPVPPTRVTFADRGNLMRSPWKFRRHGQSGIPMSSLWKHLPQVADQLCMLHSMCETNVAHGGACMKLHTGNESQVWPSMGSWLSYGLGTQNRNLPSFITICPTSLHGGVNNFGAAFLPAVHQGVPLGTPGYPNTLAKDASFPFMTNTQQTRAQQRLQLDLLQQLASQQGAATAEDPRLEARIQSYELAFRMQRSAPEALDVTRETESTRKLYGLDDPVTENFGLQCLLARRLAERGVRFIQVSHAHSLKFNNEQWDQHTHLVKGHTENVRQIDKPITGLILDLKRRGMLDDTLVIWGGEFGRTPTVQVSKSEPGRDHHPDGFTMWMAGGGVRGGFRYGATDPFGYYAVEDRMTIHDWHATILHLLGLDHKRLTYTHAGRQFRLTDVSGIVAEKILA